MKYGKYLDFYLHFERNRYRTVASDPHLYPVSSIQHPASSQTGFTLLEIILALLILAIAISPIVNAYVPAMISTSGKEEMATFSNQLKGTLERVLALDFSTLTNNQGNPVDLEVLFGSALEANKETFSLNGQSYTPVVAIADASGGAGGLLEVTASLNGVTLKTLKAQH